MEDKVIRRPLPSAISNELQCEVERLRNIIAEKDEDNARKKLHDLIVTYRLDGLDNY